MLCRTLRALATAALSVTLAGTTMAGAASAAPGTRSTTLTAHAANNASGPNRKTYTVTDPAGDATHHSADITSLRITDARPALTLRLHGPRLSHRAASVAVALEQGKHAIIVGRDPGHRAEIYSGAQLPDPVTLRCTWHSTFTHHTFVVALAPNCLTRAHFRPHKTFIVGAFTATPADTDLSDSTRFTTIRRS